MEDWPPDEFDARLLAAPRVVVLFHAEWCALSRELRPAIEEADAEVPIPFVVADLSELDDPRWEAHDVRVVPTLAYFDHGEELERVDGVLGVGIPARALQAFLDQVATLEEDDRARRKTAGWRRYRPWLERADGL